MNDGLEDAFRHSAWANKELIAFCRRLTPEQLSTPVSGTYGSILETLQHMIEAESSYRAFFFGSFPDGDKHNDPLPSLDKLDAWSAELATFWEELIEKPVDAGTILVRISPSGNRREEPAGIMIAQTLHHANVHREQVNMLLTAQGIEPPDLDAWVYGLAKGMRRGPS